MPQPLLRAEAQKAEPQPNDQARAAFFHQENPMNASDTTPPTDNPDGAGTAPFDRTNLVAGETPDTSAGEAETRPATGPGPIGGEATVAASSWGGASDGEMEDLRRSEHEREDTKST